MDLAVIESAVRGGLPLLLAVGLVVLWGIHVKRDRKVEEERDTEAKRADEWQVRASAAEAKVEMLERRVDELEDRVRQLERDLQTARSLPLGPTTADPAD